VSAKRRIWKNIIDRWNFEGWWIRSCVFWVFLKWILLPYRLRLYGEATAVVMNIGEICRFVKFAIVWVIDHPDGICGWNIDISSDLKWYVIDSDSELAMSGTCSFYWCIWRNWCMDVLSHIQHL